MHSHIQMGLTIVDVDDWTTSFLDEYIDVIPREDAPNFDIGRNLFLADLTSAKLALIAEPPLVLSGFNNGNDEDDNDNGDTNDRRRTQERIFYN